MSALAPIPRPQCVPAPPMRRQPEHGQPEHGRLGHGASMCSPPGPAAISLAALTEEIRRIEGGFGRSDLRPHVPTGLPLLDAQLPGGGFAAAAVHELAASCGGGPRTLALWLARRASADGGHLLWLDENGDFYPPAAWAWGVDPARLVLVRPRNGRDAFWAMDQALRCRGVAAVVGRPGRLTRAEARRLQLAAESGGGVGLLLCGGASAASVGAASRWWVRPMEGHGLSAGCRELPSGRHWPPVGRHGLSAREPDSRQRSADPNCLLSAAQVEFESRITAGRGGATSDLPRVLSAQRFWVQIERCRGGGVFSPVCIEADRDAGLVALPAVLADRTDPAALAGVPAA